ncbi:MAG: two-component regulator propeller domain-containing protein [Vicinamibacterales bacterium]
MRRALVGLLACAGVWCAEAYAQTAEVAPLHGYAIASWSSGEGRALGPVRGLAQDAHGYLWLAAGSGLLRFDGFHFTDARAIVSPPLPDEPANVVLFSRAGDLWVGFAEGGGIFRIRDGRAWGGPVTGRPGAVYALAEDADGVLWAGSDRGLLRWDGTRWEPVGATEGFTAAHRVFHLRASQTALFVGAGDGLFTKAAGVPGFSRLDAAGDQVIRGSVEVPWDGAVWVTDPLRAFRRLRGDPLAGEPEGIPGRGSELFRDSRDNVWLTTIGQGLWRFRAESGALSVEHATVQGGLLTDGIWSMLEDREGNLWIGTHEGLNRLTPHRMVPLTGLGVVTSVARAPDGTMWGASTDGIVAMPAGEGPRRQFQVPGARTILVDRQGRVWVGAWDGLYTLSGERFSPVRPPRGVPLRRIAALALDRDDALWVADPTQGLWRFAAGRWEPHPLAHPAAAERITAMHGARDGRLWIGFESGRAGVRSPAGDVIVYGPAQGLTHERINGIHEDASGGIWLGGTHGLSRFHEGEFVTFGRTRGLPSQRIVSMAEDRDGGLWLGLGEIGIAHVSPDELTRALADPAYRLHPQVFDTSDGIAGMPINLDSRTTVRDERGRIWFVTGRGLTVVEPEVAQSRPHASGAVRVEGAIADDQRFEPADAAALPAGTNRLRIDYTAINLTSPEHTRFRYRLEGFDETWRDAGQRRQAFYTNLAPQAYTFRVQADPGDGSWRDSSAAWTFSIAPRVYQTWTFYAVCAVGALAVVGCAWRLRLRRVHKEFAAVLAERARLSRELHDTLLQTMVGVSLHLDNVAAGSPPADPATREQLVSLRHEIEHCILDARQTIADMRAGSSERGDLISSLERVGARATAQTDVRFRLRVSGTPFHVPPRIEVELMRIAQEAVTNAVRHACPSELTMELQYTPGAISLRVVDDGSGFEEATHPAAGHFGLVTMRERAQQVGGRLQLTSAAGAGTQIEAVIPV